MSELLDRRQANAEVILEFPRIDGNVELDQIIRHYNLYGRCLFRVGGEEQVRIYPVEGEVEDMGEHGE